MLDEIAVAILQELRRRQEGRRSEQEWRGCVEVAVRLKLPLDEVLSRYDQLAVKSLAELRSTADAVTEEVDARLTGEGRRWIDAWLREQQMVVSQPVIDSGIATAYPYDVFVSHASQDNAYIDPIVDALEATSITAWYDRDKIETGDVALEKMNDGITSSRSFVVFASPSYFAKPFARRELATILHLNTLDESRKVLVVLLRMSHEDLRRSHAMLSALINIDSAVMTSRSVVRGVAHHLLTREGCALVERPAVVDAGPIEVVSLEPSIYFPGKHESPQDAIVSENSRDDMPEMRVYWFTPGFVGGVFSIEWVIENAGKTKATDIAIFMPGLDIYRIGSLEPGERDIKRMSYDERYAYYEIMKPPISAVVEFANGQGALYRQYAAVSAFPKWGDRDAEYVTTELGYAYRVEKRIVVVDNTDRFHRSRAIGWSEPE